MILTAATQTTSATKNFMMNSVRVLGDECARGTQRIPNQN